MREKDAYPTLKTLWGGGPAIPSCGKLKAAGARVFQWPPPQSNQKKMPTLNEILAAKAKTTTVLVANDDVVEIPIQAGPPKDKPITGRLAGFTTPGEQIPMEWAAGNDDSGKAWQEARHSLADSIGVLIDPDGKGWIILTREKASPIFLHGPMPSIIAPF